jgi:peptidyl-prolyl cis-trans isomerase C
MLREIARRVTVLPRIVAVLGLLLVGTVGSARAAYLSSGIFSDQTNTGSADALDPTAAPAVNPFTGIQPPDTKIANAISAPADPLVANVEGHPIYLSELGEAVNSLPEALRKMPFEVIYPLLLDRMVDHEALVLMAIRQHLDEDPAVKRQLDAATARVLEGALLERAAVPQITEAAIRARYQKEFGAQPTVEEVHARHILVSTEAEAKRLIDELNKGADFATLARRFSKDPDGVRGGDLGFFRRDQVWQGFANVAFALKPGEVAQTPISNEFGWHVVQVLERRAVPPPSFEQVREAISKQLLQEAVQRIVAEARIGLRVHEFNLNGTPVDAGSEDNPLGVQMPGYVRPPNQGNPPADAGSSVAPQNIGN